LIQKIAGQPLDVRAREEGAAVVDGVAGLRREHERFVAVPVEDDLGEVEDRLFAAVGRDHLRLRIDVDAEAALAPARDRLSQLRQPFRERIAREWLDALDEGAADQRIRLLARVALAEVDQLHAVRCQPPLRLLEADEGIRAGGGENGGELHLVRRYPAPTRTGEGPRRSA